MRVIAIANQKGGCGKTTTAINLSGCLAFLHKKVLLIDLDPQGHSTCGLGIKGEFLERSTYDLFHDQNLKPEDLAVPVSDNLSVIPTHVVLSNVEKDFASRGDERLMELAHRIGKIKANYDYVIIDSPPNLGFLTFNALHAAQEVIIPIEPSFFSLHGLAKIFETIDTLVRDRSIPIRVHALMTRYEKRSKLGREIYDEVKKHFQDQTFIHVIHENIRLKEAAAVGKSIVDYDRNSPGFRDYMGLAIEMIERGLLWQGADRAPLPKFEHDVQEKKDTAKDDAQSPTATEEENTESESASPLITGLDIPHPKLLGEDETDRLGQGTGPRTVLGGTLFSYVSQQAKSVMLAGDFNRWIAEPMALMDSDRGLWQKVVPVDPGVYHYKFLVDDHWQTDPFNQITESNPYGGFDSVIKVTDQKPVHDYKKEAETGTA